MTHCFLCISAWLVVMCGCASAPLTPVIDDVQLLQAIQLQHQESLTAHLRQPHPYPIMLVHGMAGFRPIGRYIDYFYQVRHTVTASGYEVFAAQTDAFQTVDYRARQLAIQVDEALNLSGADKLHLIAHSQGGLDARYLISTLGYGDRIATLTTVGTPHQGVKLVDIALRLSPMWVGRVASVIDAISDSLLGGNANLIAALHDLTQAHVRAEFNPHNFDDSRVEYFSYSGQTQASPFVDPRHADIVNPLLLASYHLNQALEGDNDGVVSTASSRWGTYLGTFMADHWDEIGQPPTTSRASFDHLRFYADLSRFLANAGEPPQY